MSGSKKKRVVNPIQDVVNMKEFIIKYKKPIVITVGITVLNIAFGFDPRFTIINLLWLLV